MDPDNASSPVDAVAIVGLACRFPGAADAAAFWRNLCDGVESIRRFSADELAAAGVSPELTRQPNYVPARGTLPDIEHFDAAFFGMAALEAQITDPQHRLLLECAWEALEDAGCNPDAFDGRIGVYAGVGLNTYLLRHLAGNDNLVRQLGTLPLLIANDKDFAATRISYKLNLRGPSLNINTACSSGLTAVQIAYQSLLDYRCDAALAGAVAAAVPQCEGYLYEAGSILSPDGHCRAFDAAAAGTVGGSGAGMVVLKRLEDALAQGDSIYAVIRGAAINNDGSDKVGFTAPSVNGQAQVLAEALQEAEIDPSTVSYIETHGTGTNLGDAIEVAALREVYSARRKPDQRCALGSVKTNIGHADTAAGIAGLIKTALALRHGKLPPHLHFQSPNPKLKLDESPFYVVDRLQAWPRTGTPRRAGVSSFGIGGTNVHLVVEEPALRLASPSARPGELLLLSARSNEALEQATKNLAHHLRANPEVSLADTAFTLATGRKAFVHRRLAWATSAASAASALEEQRANHVATQTAPEQPLPVVFLFTGQGVPWRGVAAHAYRDEPAFRHAVDDCLGLLDPDFSWQLRRLLLSEAQDDTGADTLTTRTDFAQPALFIIEYALAQWWRSCGITAAAAVGHSLGEVTAACLAGVFSLSDALRLVVERGRCIQEAPDGSMVAVAAAEEEVRASLSADLSLAAVNGDHQCVVAGSVSAVAAWTTSRAANGQAVRPLKATRAFHSEMMDAAARRFGQSLASVRFHEPALPLVSGVTGTWAQARDVTQPDYWQRQMRETVRFAAGIDEVRRRFGEVLWIEVGPGHTLSRLVEMRTGRQAGARLVASLPETPRPGGLGRAAAEAWLHGAPVSWNQRYADEKRLKVSLPTYPFERRRYWIDAPRPVAPAARTVAPAGSTGREITDCLYEPTWAVMESVATNLDARLRAEARTWLVFDDGSALLRELLARLRSAGQEVLAVATGPGAEANERSFHLDPESAANHDTLIAALVARPAPPTQIVWPSFGAANANAEKTFAWLARLTGALGKHLRRAARVTVLVDRVWRVGELPSAHPELAVLLGPVLVAPQETPLLRCRCVDLPDSSAARRDAVIEECLDATEVPCVVRRGTQRWRRDYRRLKATSTTTTGWVRGGVYLITGGLGGLGLALAEHLATEYRAKLILVGRSVFPPQENWSAIQREPATVPALRATLQRLLDLEARGAELCVRTADVADRAALAAAVQAGRARFGAIDGVVHAAGLPGSGLLHGFSPERAHPVLATKVTGTLNLAAVLAQEPPALLVLCSSLNAALGGIGQADYCGANAFLDAYAEQHAADATKPRVLAVNWDTWREVGMAVKAAAPAAKAWRPVDPPHPLLTETRVDPAGRSYRTVIALETHWIVREHTWHERGVFPGTAFLELARAAYTNLTGATQLCLEEAVFTSPLLVAPGHPQEVSIGFERAAEGHRFVVTSRALDGPGEAREHAHGVIRTDRPSTHATMSLDALIARCGPEAKVQNPVTLTMGEGGLRFGPRWSGLRRVWSGPARALAEIELAEEFSREDTPYQLHPALLDLSVGFAQLLRPGAENFVPHGYRDLRIFGALPRQVYALTGNASARAGDSESDEVRIFDANGRELVAIAAYTRRRVVATPAPEVAAANERPTLPRTGDFSSFVWRPVPRPAPAADEVEIEVAATGLNFKDVLAGLGAVAGPAEDRPPLGLECAGIVTRCGANVVGLRPGDAVMGWGRNCFDRVVCTAAGLVAPLPSSLDFAAGAALPVAYATAYHVLVNVARLRSGERVLIHAGAGGVGTAAIAVARRAGAEIFATAGSEEKRAYLRSAGVTHVFDSRTLDFARGVLEATGGRGVDVVLNSLAGDYIAKGLEVLAPGGRFLELGARDIHENNALRLGVFSRGLLFAALQVGPAMPGFPELWAEVAGLLQRGELPPLPLRAFPTEELAQAFEHLSRARHIGKVVVTREAVMRRGRSRRQPTAPAEATTQEAANPFLANGLSTAEGLRLFSLAPSLGGARLLVSTEDFARRLAEAATPFARRGVDPAPPPPASAGHRAQRDPRPALPTAYVAPASETERSVAELMSALLGIDGIGTNDDFFALGGDSLLGTRLIAQVRDVFHVDLPIGNVFERPTVAGLAERIAAARGTSPANAASGSEAERETGEL